MPQLAKNRKAFADYDILDKFEAGIALTGPEVKSTKAGQINLKGAYVSLTGDQIWLKQTYISPYRYAKGSQKDYNPDRHRRLLLKRGEIKSLIGKTGSKGLTIIPLSVYTKGGLVKVEIALVTGKKKWDRRADIKKRETDRKINRALRQKNR
ncbi:MAG: SsrA-binding protein SmpB [Patescibacteria group bacterium]